MTVAGSLCQQCEYSLGGSSVSASKSNLNSVAVTALFLTENDIMSLFDFFFVVQ